MIKIARLFFCFDRFLAVKSIGGGNINDTYRLDLEVAGGQKTVLLQRLNHHVFKQPQVVMDNTLQVCKYLVSQDYPYQVPEPLPGIDGQFFQKDEAGNFWRAFSFIEQSYSPEGVSDPAIAYEAARAYGAFEKALQDFPAKTLAETSSCLSFFK